MKAFNSLVLFCLLMTQSASAQITDLSGAWTVDASACGAVFTDADNRLAFKPDADLHADGLIIKGRRVSGTLSKCTIHIVSRRRAEC